jgi:hypothetical protein
MRLRRFVTDFHTTTRSDPRTAIAGKVLACPGERVIDVARVNS